MKREFRSLKARELRAEKTEDGKQYLSGYAATFNTLSEELCYFRERIMPGAFSRALQEKQDVRHLKNHDPNLVLGRTKSGTLELSEDAKGLKFRTLMPDTSYARDLIESVSRGDIDECSFGFQAVRTVWIDEPDPDDDKQQRCIRELHDVDLFDISTVTYPAYPNTSSTVERSLRTMFPDGVPGEVQEHVPQLKALPEARAKRKTKRVDGEDLTSDCFLIVGDPQDTSTWKLPVKFSTEEKSKEHVQKAIQLFSTMKDVSEDVKKKAWTKLMKLAKKYGIEVSAEEEKSWQNYTRRDFDFDNDGDNDQPLVDAIANVAQDASDFAMVASACLSEVSNADQKDAVPALQEALTEARELQGLVAEFIAEAEAELSEEEPVDEELERMRMRAQLELAA
jgi:HK97 family phage prohead protease